MIKNLNIEITAGHLNFVIKLLEDHEPFLFYGFKPEETKWLINSLKEQLELTPK